MVTDTQHWDVGAYVLGVLDHADIEAFEAHLAMCDDCADEVESLLPVVGVLANVDSAAVVARNDGATRAGHWLLPAMAPHRRGRRSPRHGQLAPAAGRSSRGLAVAASIIVVVVAALSFLVGAQWGGSDGSTAGGERFEATEPSTGVHAELDVTRAQWGSQVDMSLAGIRGPLRCELVAIDAKANSTVVASWTVPVAGYGVPEQPNPLILQASTATTLAATTRYEIRATSSSGAVTTLLTIPV